MYSSRKGRRRRREWILWGVPLAMVAIAGGLIASTQRQADYADWYHHWITAAVGSVMALFLERLPLPRLRPLLLPIYGLTLVSLLAVKAIGTQRWGPSAGFRSRRKSSHRIRQTRGDSAGSGSARPSSGERPVDLLRPLGVISVPWLLVFVQPDLGTSLVFGALMLTMLYWSGMPLEWVVLLLAPLLTALFSLQLPGESLQAELAQAFASTAASGISTLPAGSHLTGVLNFLGYLWNGGLRMFLVDSFSGERLPMLAGILSWMTFTSFLAYRSLPWKRLAALGNAVLQISTVVAAPILWGVVLQDYQRDRLILFLDPSQDPLGGGYHLLQSMVGIGSGGLFGIGLLQGQLTKLRFIPEQHTDFIFSALGEETGFVGCILVVVGFALLMGRLLQVARNARTISKPLL